MKAMLARNYDDRDATGWWMSEKLDGVRALWDGSRLMSRNGNLFHAPDWFLESLPREIALDGELFTGRGAFQKTLSTVKRRRDSDGWRAIRYMVFDAPEVSGGFESRLRACEKVVSGSKIISLLPQTKCDGKEHLREFSTSLVNAGAEGVMLRSPGSSYEAGRSDLLLKYKPVDSDEATILGYESGSGKNESRMGTLICIWKLKVIRIGAGITDLIRAEPPKVGSEITFQYCGLTDSGMPRFPVFVSERNYE